MISRISSASVLCMALLLVGTFPAESGNDIEQQRSCTHCGMDRKAYGYSRMLVKYADGSQSGVCSLHCAVTEMNTHPDKKITTMQVADRNNQDLLEAPSAFWITGGRKRGVMTGTPTWAFATQEAAVQFIHDHGGTLSTWENILAAARKEAVR